MERPGARIVEPLRETNLPGIPRHSQGKVRDVYRVGDQLLIVASDRISAFDHVLPTGIPRKGEVLTQMSLYWFRELLPLVPNHLISADVGSFPTELQPFREQLAGRSMLVKRLEMFPVECVARGYLSGSGWKEYQQTGAICGIPLPAGLKESDRLPEPIFTPATKAESGHDENIGYAQVVRLIGEESAARLRDLTLALYRAATERAEAAGIILADTKFEFGLDGGQITLGDEVLTPDSSRFWPKDTYRPGGPQFSYDKQYVRDYLESIHWNKQTPAPSLPAEVAEKTSEKYQEAYYRLTGQRL